ncbi:MAG TPA: tetratricopeptide repeat protein [Fimbriimonadaceae bacterium]|nr:tetratricopeptide repeat protein [Fimbriimonadaceae bacterium]
MCDRCFAMLGDADEFCPDCGAPTSKEGVSEGSDSEIYPELARANLLRMRGEYKQAEDVCLAILRRFPNNATANTLLGDICAERGDLEQAAEWYELAIDLMPESASEKAKLAKVRERMQERQAAKAAHEFELHRKSNAPMLAMVGVVAFVAFGLIAFLVGRNLAPPTAKGVLEIPKVEQPQKENVPMSQSGPIPQPSSEQPEGKTTGTMVRLEDDEVILNNLAQRSPEGVLLIEATQDKRTLGLRLTYALDDGVDPRVIGAKLGASAMAAYPDAGRIVVRGVRERRVVYMATVARSDYESTVGQNLSDDALADQLLIEEWSLRP